jgi:hypothetical protein
MLLGLAIFLSGRSLAATKPHVVLVGRWISVKMSVDDESNVVDVKVRPLMVDGQIKEYVTGSIHDVTVRTFVAQRIYRLNDSLPQDASLTWKWEPGGWIQVDRLTGKVHQIALQSFVPAFSFVSWFRDYAAYCGLSDDGQKVFALVSQIGRHKPLLKNLVGTGSPGSSGTVCGPPVWQRNPSRATFPTADNQKLTFSIKTRTADLTTLADDEGED